MSETIRGAKRVVVKIGTAVITGAQIDHLSGTVFGDRLSTRSRRLLDQQKRQAAHLYPDDWPISPKGTRSAM